MPRRVLNRQQSMQVAPGFKNRKSRIRGGGYWRIYQPGHPRADQTGYVIEQRVIVEQHLGRALRDDEIVHHKNHDKLDNRIENLQVMSHSEHAKIHGRKFHAPYKPPRKFIDAQIREIRRRYARGGISQAALGKDYGACQQEIADIVNLRRYTHVPGSKLPPVHRRNVSKLTPDQIIAIRKRYAEGGIFQRQLAEKYGVIQQTIHQIVSGKHWRHIH